MSIKYQDIEVNIDNKQNEQHNTYKELIMVMAAPIFPSSPFVIHANDTHLRGGQRIELRMESVRLYNMEMLSPIVKVIHSPS